MRYRNTYKLVLVLLMFLLCITNAFSQNWQEIDDSTYYSIVKNRFNKGNIHFGAGGAIRYGYESPYTVFSFGGRTQAGYFVANRWLLSGQIEFYRGYLESDTSSGNADYFRYLAGPQVRYYFKPKHRTLFCQLSVLAGHEDNNVTEIPDNNQFSNFIYGGTIAGGVSVFIRRFEFELLAGFTWYSADYKDDNDYFPNTILQINLSYILNR